MSTVFLLQHVHEFDDGHEDVKRIGIFSIRATRTILKRQFAQNKPYPSNPVSLGDHLRKQRLDQRLTQPEVAVKLGVSLATVVKWEIR
jgi:DNA-binding transcriptional regulator YiaG